MKYFWFLLISLALVGLFCQFCGETKVEGSDKKCIHDASNFRCVKYIRNYDGDTITVDIPSVHPLLGKTTGVRVNGIDTPEIRGKTLCEREKALQAKMFVIDLCATAKRIDLLNVERGKYFRVVADVVCDGRSISRALIAQGLAYPYDGGTKKEIDWCKK